MCSRHKGESIDSEINGLGAFFIFIENRKQAMHYGLDYL